MTPQELTKVIADNFEWRYNYIDKTQPIANYGDRTFTVEEVKAEIENQTEFGKEIEKAIISLTVDLWLRGKEKLQLPTE